MKAGFAKRCVNPPIGMPMEGLNQKEVSQAIHDDLFVRTLFLEHGKEEAVIVSFDLLFFERPVIDRYKGALGRTLELRPDQIFINTTHTHAGPRMTRWSYSGEPEALYLEQLEEALLSAAVEARKRCRPVTIWAGETRTQLPVSRRRINQEGKAEWKPFPEGVVCDALPWCLLKDEAGAVVSLLFSVACHPSMIYLPAISAEYPGVAMRILNEHFGTEGSFFLQGAAGDTKPRHVATDERWRDGTWEEMEAAGAEVAEAVICSVNAGAVRAEPELQTFLLDVDWPLEAPPTKAALVALAANEAVRRERRIWAGDMLERLDRKGELPRVVPVGLHFLQLGKGLRLLGVEGEVLARLGLRMLEIYDKGITFALGYTNGTQIYMPVTEELGEEGYEVVSFWEYHHPAISAEGCEKPLLEALRQARDSGLIPNTPLS